MDITKRLKHSGKKRHVCILLLLPQIIPSGKSKNPLNMDFASLLQIMAADEMKKNVERLEELDDALKDAQQELIVGFSNFKRCKSYSKTFAINWLLCLYTDVCFLAFPLEPQHRRGTARI